MSIELLKQLQATTGQFRLQRFDVVVVAFGKAFAGTVVSHEPFMAMLKAQSLEIKFSPNEWTHTAIAAVREKLEEAYTGSMRDESDTTLYLANVTIEGAVKAPLMTIPFKEVRAWSLVGVRKIDASQLVAESEPAHNR